MIKQRLRHRASWVGKEIRIGYAKILIIGHISLTLQYYMLGEPGEKNIGYGKRIHHRD